MPACRASLYRLRRGARRHLVYRVAVLRMRRPPRSLSTCHRLWSVGLRGGRSPWERLGQCPSRATRLSYVGRGPSSLSSRMMGRPDIDRPAPHVTRRWGSSAIADPMRSPMRSPIPIDPVSAAHVDIGPLAQRRKLRRFPMAITPPNGGLCHGRSSTDPTPMQGRAIPDSLFALGRFVSL